MNRVRCDNKVDHDRSEKDQVFDRVHRQARPWSHVNVAMVQRMDMFIQKRDVERAVNPVKIKALPDRDQKEQCDEPNRMRSLCQYGGITVGHCPEHQHLIGSPDGNTAGNCPEYIVAYLPA